MQPADRVAIERTIMGSREEAVEAAQRTILNLDEPKRKRFGEAELS